MAKLGEVCTIVSGSTPKTSVTSYWDGNIKWITPAELNEDTFYICYVLLGWQHQMDNTC